MDDILLITIDEQLNMWRAKLKRESARLKEIAEYGQLRLVSSSPKEKNSCLYVVERGKTQRKYIPRDSETSNLIREAHYLEESIAKTKENIRGLEKYRSKYELLDYDSVNNSLSPLYRGCYTGKVVPPNEKAAKWLEDMTRFKEKFNEIHPDKYPKDKRVQAADGRLMRSKAEALIADLANARGLVNIHELPHYCNGIWIRTDITILSPIDWYTTFAIEHEGMLDKESYQEKHIHNQVHYMAEGFKPNINLFYSYDYFDGSFSLAAINRIFDEICRSVPPKSLIERLHPSDEEVLQKEIEGRYRVR